MLCQLLLGPKSSDLIIAKQQSPCVDGIPPKSNHKITFTTESATHNAQFDGIMNLQCINCLVKGAPFRALHPVSAAKHQQREWNPLPTTPWMVNHNPCPNHQHPHTSSIQTIVHVHSSQSCSGGLILCSNLARISSRRACLGAFSRLRSNLAFSSASAVLLLPT